MNFQTTVPLTVTATSILQADGSISINLVMTTAGTDGNTQQFAQASHYINAHDAQPLVDQPPSAAEMTAGLSLRDIVTARGLAFLCTRYNQPLAALLPEAMRPVSA